MREYLDSYWREISRVSRMMPIDALDQAASMLLACQHRGGTVYTLGNGGSAATASHFACDLAKGTQAIGTARFRVVALTDNVPLLTAWANDTDYRRIFAEQLQPLMRREDLLVAISASGNSANVLDAIQVARAVNATTVALTGRCGGRVRRLADLLIRVPADAIEQVEDAHLAVVHSLCVALRRQLALEAACTRPFDALEEPIAASSE